MNSWKNSIVNKQIRVPDYQCNVLHICIIQPSLRNNQSFNIEIAYVSFGSVSTLTMIFSLDRNQTFQRPDCSVQNCILSTIIETKFHFNGFRLHELFSIKQKIMMRKRSRRGGGEIQKRATTVNTNKYLSVCVFVVYVSPLIPQFH